MPPQQNNDLTDEIIKKAVTQSFWIQQMKKDILKKIYSTSVGAASVCGMSAMTCRLYTISPVLQKFYLGYDQPRRWGSPLWQLPDWNYGFTLEGQAAGIACPHLPYPCSPVVPKLYPRQVQLRRTLFHHSVSTWSWKLYLKCIRLKILAPWWSLPCSLRVKVPCLLERRNCYPLPTTHWHLW